MGAGSTVSGTAEVLVSELRKIESESEARRCLAKVEKAGVSLKAWAQAHGVDGRSLHAWKTNLARWGRGRAKAAAPMQLVELVPTKASVAPARYAVRVGSASVEFGDDFEADTLRRIVEVLRSC